MTVDDMYIETNRIVYGTPTEADMLAWFNQGLRRIGRDVPLWETTTLTIPADTRTVDLPSDYIDLDRLLDEDGDPYEDFSVRYTGAKHKLILRENLDVEKDFTLDYWKLPSKLTQGSDEPEILKDYHWLLPYYAAYIYKVRQEEAGEAETSVLWQQFQAGWKELVEAVNSQGEPRFGVEEVW